MGGGNYSPLLCQTAGVGVTGCLHLCYCKCSEDYSLRWFLELHSQTRQEKLKPASNWHDFRHSQGCYVRDLRACWALCYYEGRQYDVPGLKPVEP